MTSSPAVDADPQPRIGEGLDPGSPNRNLVPISLDRDGEGRLRLAGCGLSDLAHRFGTPLYVIDEATLRATCRAYR
ncbi:MAG: diaminopimelate decarboxylase, partial [Cyanobacteriota bacterium]